MSEVGIATAAPKKMVLAVISHLNKGAAALVKSKASPTAKNYRRCRNSTAHFHHAAKAWLRNKQGIGRIQNAPVPWQH